MADIGAAILSLQMADIKVAIADIGAAIRKHKIGAPCQPFLGTKWRRPFYLIKHLATTSQELHFL